jgi:uncharacterized membrane protein YeaQ/YmgE (transglycosylase-associated protein family)
LTQLALLAVKPLGPLLPDANFAHHSKALRPTNKGIDVGVEVGREKGREMGIIAFLILGLLAGAIAKALLPGDDPGGIIVTMIIGVVGALLGGFLAGALFNARPMDEFFDLSTWLTAIIGSIILLVIYRLVVGRRRVT